MRWDCSPGIDLLVCVHGSLGNMPVVPLAARAIVHYLYCLVLFGVPFALFQAGAQHDAAKGLHSGLFYGTCMAIAIGTVSLWRSGGAPSYRVRQHRVIVVPGSPPAVTETIRRALYHLNARPLADDGAHFEAQTGVDWSTWGERVTVDVWADDDGTRVAVDSRPRWRLTPIDYGRNRRNVEAIVAS